MVYCGLTTAGTAQWPNAGVLLYVINDDVDPQLRQRLVLAECSTERCKNAPLFLITRVCLLTLNIMTNLLRKNVCFL